jgi:hypothetical protein
MASSSSADLMSNLSIEEEYQDDGPTIDDIISATIGEAEDDLDRSSGLSLGPEQDKYTPESLPLNVYVTPFPSRCCC